MDPVGLGEVLEAFNVIDVEWHTFCYLCDPGITGSTKEFRHARGLRELPRQRVLTSPVSYD
jgi:hypothetical protein